MNTTRPDITLICSRLDLPGGIERATVNLANLLSQKGHAVTLLILDEYKSSFYPLRENIRTEQLSLHFGITEKGNTLTRKFRFLKDIRVLKKWIHQHRPSVIIATEYPFVVASVMAGAQSFSKLLAWQHQHHALLEKNRFWDKLCKLTYPKTDKVICLNQTEAAFYAQTCRTTVIPNFIDVPAEPVSANRQKQLLTVGWLTKTKGMDMIGPVAKIIFEKHPDWTWKIIGKGTLKQDLLEFIEKEKLQQHLILREPTGFALDAEYSQSSIYVLPSRNEAFPMVLLEAMAQGLPCISFNCLSGPSEIITDQADGLLVEAENTDALAVAIEKLIENSALRDEMGKQAQKNIRRFAPDTVYSYWEKAFSS